MPQHSSNGSRRQTPARSEQVSLEVALLASASLGENRPPVALIVAADADVRAYVSESLRQRTAFDVVATGSVSSALEAAAHNKPGVLVVAHGERSVLNHLPAVPAVLLSDDASASEVTDTRRLAPVVVLRGSFRIQHLLEAADALVRNGNA